MHIINLRIKKVTRGIIAREVIDYCPAYQYFYTSMKRTRIIGLQSLVTISWQGLRTKWETFSSTWCWLLLNANYRLRMTWCGFNNYLYFLPWITNILNSSPRLCNGSKLLLNEMTQCSEIITNKPCITAYICMTSRHWIIPFRCVHVLPIKVICRYTYVRIYSMCTYKHWLLYQNQRLS